MKNIINFGLLTSFAIAMALVADYFITPALMVLMNPKKVAEEHRESEAAFTGLQPEPEI